MRCKNHYSDLSSTVGVCASCLRHRLQSLIAAEEQIEARIQNSDGKQRNSEKNPAVLPAVSSQFNCRKSDRSDDTSRNDHRVHRLHPHVVHVPRHRHSLSDQLFDRTPEVRPTTGGNSKKKRSFIRLLPFNIFRSRNRKSTDTVTDPRASDSTVRESRGGNSATSSSSSSWFSIISGGRNRHRRKQTLCTDESTTTAGDGPVRRQHCGGRGMSPARNSDVVTGDEVESQNATSGLSESTESLKHTPRRTPAVRRGGSGGHVRNISGLSFCLSPLVRASPNLQWNHKGLPPDVVLPADVGAPVKPHLSYARSFCANRSRKLVDYGRLNPNR